MASTPKVYVLCDQNCKWEGMTREEILTAIAQAVEDGKITDVDTGFVRTIRTINNQPLRFFVGSQAEYNALPYAEKDGLFAIITDDVTKDGIEAAIKELNEARTAHEERIAANEAAIETHRTGIAQINDTLARGVETAKYFFGDIVTTGAPTTLTNSGFFHIMVRVSSTGNFYNFGVVGWFQENTRATCDNVKLDIDRNGAITIRVDNVVASQYDALLISKVGIW